MASMTLDSRWLLRWRLVLAGFFLGLALVGSGCASGKADLQRSDVEQMYKDGQINRITYDDMMHQIDKREAAAKAGTTVAPANASAPPAATPAPASSTPSPGHY
jgi:hypothetical protein